MAEFIQQWGSWLDDSGWADVVGFVSALVGLLAATLACIGAWQAHDAARTARDAAQATMRRLGMFEAVDRLTSTLAQLDAMLDRFDREDRSVLARTVRDQRRELIKVREAGVLVASADRTVLQDTIATLGQIEDVLGESIGVGDVNTVAAYRQLLRGHLDNVLEVSLRLQKNVVRDDNGS